MVDNEASEAIGNIGDLIQAVRAIKAMDRQVEILENDKSAMMRWYNERIARQHEQKGRMEGLIDGYLDFTKRKSVATPSGTAFRRTFETWEWPEDGVLLHWAKELNRGDFVKATEAPSRSAIKAALKEGQVVDPPGLRRTSHTKIIIGRPGEVTDENEGVGIEGNGGGATPAVVPDAHSTGVTEERAA